MINRIDLRAHPVLAKFIAKMDNAKWFRLIVCSAPGLILAKFWQISQMPWLGITASLTLGAGILIYAGWEFGRKRLKGETEVETESEASEDDSMEYFELQPAIFHIDLINELVDKCNMTLKDVFDAIKLEASIWPDVHLAVVIESTHRRKMTEASIKSRSGS